ncbi:MAG: hypothetical protein FWC16_02795 [Defluviitaleaceae bacterium]|nr:hypothetical protein [Defluviitaleaceae bacterium]MCL2273828.1 hypothetical protein [Defluviitaleaceae bacterium]
MEYKPIWSMEYVYNAEGSEEFRQLRITLELSESDGRITLEPSHMMTIKELNNVMRDYQQDLLEKMMTAYDTYYPVRLLFNGIVCKVEFDSKREVTGIAIQ